MASYTMSSGSGNIDVTYESGLDDQGETNVTYSAIAQSVVVTPKGQAVNALASTPTTQAFTVQNTGVATETFALATICTGSVTACSVSPSSVTISAASSAPATVSYTPGTVGSTAVIKLTAKDATYSTPADTGSINETAISNALTARPPVVDVATVNAGTTVDKNLCLTIAAGPNAASECGALRIVHPLRSIRTLNKVRTPTLIYSSAQAQPLPVVDANITLDSQTKVPDTIVVVLKGSSGQGLDSVRIKGSAWGLPSTTRRVALRYSAVASPTDLYKYTVEARNIYNGSSVQTGTTTGQLIVVNRSTSEFGAGWWLAGLERLYLTRTDTILWVGGDGSARIYTRKSSTVFSAPNVDHPDSIVKVGTNYIRYLPQKLRVQFDGTTGYHTATINRLGHTTLFAYSGGTTGLLTSVTVPPGNSKKYTFSYTAASKLDTISNPGPGPQGAGNTERRRRTRAVVTGTQLMSLRDCDGGPDCNSVEFAGVINFSYAPGTNLIKTRTDRMATIRSYFYDSLYQVARDSLFLSAGKVIVTRFHNADSLARPSTLVANAIVSDSAYLRVDGPRLTPIQDYTFFWLDRFGAPRRIKDAVGDTTVVTADIVWPGLPARVRRPSGQVLKAWYNSRALIDSSMDSTHYRDVAGVRKFATTKMIWDPSFEGTTKITLPEGEESHFSYDPSTGNRLTQYPGTDTMHIVHYTYNTSGLLTDIKTPLVTRPQHFAYDLVLQNLASVKTPRGYPTTYQYDSLGRLSGTSSPIDSANSLVGGRWLVQTTGYDGLDRDTVSSTNSPAIGFLRAEGMWDSVKVQTLRVAKQYDENGNVLQLTRATSDEPRPLYQSWMYDLANRAYRITYSNGYAEHFGFDEASNVVFDTTRRGDLIVNSYDAMNRLIRQAKPAINPATFTAEGKTFPHYGSVALPADTVTFVYDSGGGITTANNFYAHITRRYNPDGTMSLDSMAMLSYNKTQWDLHNYAMRYRYDLEGRRTWFQIPSTLAPHLGSVAQDTITYSYDPTLGSLALVTDVQAGHFNYWYDREGRIDETVDPYNHSTDFTYDDTGDGQLKRMYSSSGYLCGDYAGGGYILIDPGYIFSDDIVHDGRGKVSYVGTPDRAPGHGGGVLSTTYHYSSLGALMLADNGMVEEAQALHCDGNGMPDSRTIDVYSEYGSDGFGNNTFTQVQALPDPTGEFTSNTVKYDSTTLQLVKVKASSFGAAHLDAFADTVLYDQMGSRTYLHRHNVFTSVDHWEASYYAADGKLYALDRQSSDNTDVWVTGGRSEYRYDAFGRRLQTYSKTDASCTNAACRPTVARSIWDGDRLLLELRYPADDPSYYDLDTGLVVTAGKTDYGHFGRVLYTHGVALDEPVGMIRLNYGPGTFFNTPIRITPHWNWRGLAVTGTFSDGLRFHCKGGQYVTEADTTCVDVGWSGDLAAFMRARSVWNNGSVAAAWEGSLIRQNADNSEQLYMRNRYYDPVQGRFTQEDPIGLAGGLNAYGFANGDPVNYSDPFGLCTVGKDCWKAFVAWFQGPWREAARTVPLIFSPILFETGGSGAAGAASEEVSSEVTTSFGSKIEAQLGKRGWTKDDVNGTIANPDRTAATTDSRYLADGTRMNDPATAYVNKDGSYVVRNNKSGDVVQISNRNDPNWKSPF